MQFTRFATLVIAALVVFGGFAAACGETNGQSQPVNPAPPTPGPTPAGIQTVDDAIRGAEGFIAGQSSTNVHAAHIQSVSYVTTTVGQAANFIGGYVPAMEAQYSPTTTAWLFVSQGYYARGNRFDSNAPTPSQATLWVLAIQDAEVNGDIAKAPLDLTQLGAPVTIPPGQVPEIDALRGPLSLEVGAPSLVSGQVQVPISAGNPFNASLVPYSGLNVHLRWDPAVFSYAGLSTTGSVLPSPLCVTAVSQDADGGGVVIGCASLGSQTTATGLLATVSLTPAASGCSALHLFTYVGQDHGDSSTGTYVINAFSTKPLPVQDVDGTASVSGTACTPGP